MVTRIFWSSSEGACRVRSLIRGSVRDNGVAKTVCCDSEVSADADSEDRSKWQTYLRDMSSSCHGAYHNLRPPVALDDADDLASRLHDLRFSFRLVLDVPLLLLRRASLSIGDSSALVVLCVVVLERH